MPWEGARWRRDVRIARSPHWLGSGIGLLAAAQVLAAAGGPGMLEHDVMENPLRAVLGQLFPRVRDGKCPLPDTPGLEVEPDLPAAAGWLVARVTGPCSGAMAVAQGLAPGVARVPAHRRGSGTAMIGTRMRPLEELCRALH